LARASASARRVFEFLGGGIGIHFPLCDVDISIANLLLPPERIVHYRRPSNQSKQPARRR
jgi:hypothetical protein